jgi:hypothetical protein
VVEQSRREFQPPEAGRTHAYEIVWSAISDLPDRERRSLFARTAGKGYVDWELVARTYGWTGAAEKIEEAR